MISLAVLFVLASQSLAQSNVTSCLSYATTLTFTSYETFYTTDDGSLTGSSTTTSSSKTSSTLTTTRSFTSTNGGVLTSTTAYSTSIPNGVSTSVTGSSTILIPSDTITPTTPIPTSSTTTTIASSTLTSATTTTTSSASSSGNTSSATGGSSSVTTSATASTSSSSAISTASTTTSTAAPVVTDQAYIDTVLRHHNSHRTNHSSPAISWSSGMASIAQEIAQSCQYHHNTTAGGGGYGQNIGAGYLPVQMGSLITGGFYNGEVNAYTYYGGEPDTSTVGQWGHFSQVVWAASTGVGCYTQNCTVGGLAQVDPRVLPYFTVCNYSPVGNVVGAFATNVRATLGLASINEGFDCPTSENCANI